MAPLLPRTPARNTARLFESISPLLERGIKPEEAMLIVAAPFPVGGRATFSDDWMFPRVGPPPHLHEGTDIFAAYGTPIVASSTGVVSGLGETRLGGISLWITADDGNAYYYAHLAGFHPEIVQGTRVEKGTVVGFVGDSGNAVGGLPHLHFEVHPPVMDKKGAVIASGADSTQDGKARMSTPPVNPKPILDQWLAEAEANSNEAVLSFLERYSKIARDAYFARRIEDLSPEVTQLRGPLVWLSWIEPSAPGRAMEYEVERLKAVRRAVDSRRLAVEALLPKSS